MVSTNASASAPSKVKQDEPSVGGVKVKPFWSVALYVLLVLSAGVAFFAQRNPGFDPRMAQVAPWVFLVFAIGFALYRVALVGARRYSPFKAFFQIFLAALFFLLLLFPGAQKPVAAGAGLLGHADARVRAQAAELTGWRHDLPAARLLPGLLDDESVEVRSAAHQALVRLNDGVDLGVQRNAWEQRFP